MPRKHRLITYDLLLLSLLAIVVVLFWGDCLWGGKTPVAGVYQQQMRPWSASTSAPEQVRQWDSLLWDSVAQFYPWRLLTHRAAQAGELPLWNPYQFQGYPFTGNGQSALFYPLNWLYFILHPQLGLGVSAALHFFLAACFVFGLARTLHLRPLVALFAAIAFTFGGFMVTWIELPTLVNSLIWLPLAWWGIEVLFRGQSVRGTLMLAGALGMSMLAGHLQIAAYVWLFTGVYILASLLLRRGERGKRVGWLVVAVVVGGMLAMAQLLPTLELGALSPRGGGGPSEAGFTFHQQRAVRPIELLTLLQADFLGSPVKGDYTGISYSEHCGFVGMTTLLLGLAGLWFGRKRRITWLFAGIAIFALWSAMGGLPAALLYWGIPKLGQAGGFSRLLSVWTLAAAMCGGMGLEMILRNSEQRGTNEELATPRGSQQVVKVITGLALVLLALELFPWAHRFNPRVEATKLYAETPLITRLRMEIGEGRYLAITPRSAWRLDRVPTEAVLPPNAGTAYGLRSVAGYDSLFPADYRAFAGRVEGADPAPAANGNMLLLENAPAWSKLVNCVVSAVDSSMNSLPTGEILDGCILRVHRNGSQSRACSNTKKDVFITHDGLNNVSISASGPGIVTLRDAPYPGWLAFVDCQQSTWEGASGERKVAVPAGSSQIDWIYFPATVVVGGFLSLVALTVLMSLWVLGIGSKGWR